MKFKHRDIPITVNKDGMFVGAGKSAVSLPALKRKLDETAVITPFDAYTITYKDRIERIRIVGVVRPRGTRRYGTARTLFLKATPRGDNEPVREAVHNDVYAATPENRKLLGYIISTRRLRERQSERCRKHERKLTARLTVVKPE